MTYVTEVHLGKAATRHAREVRLDRSPRIVSQLMPIEFLCALIKHRLPAVATLQHRYRSIQYRCGKSYARISNSKDTNH